MFSSAYYPALKICVNVHKSRKRAALAGANPGAGLDIQGEQLGQRGERGDALLHQHGDHGSPRNEGDKRY